MKTPAPSRYQSENVVLKRRVFFHEEKIKRNRANRSFKEVKGNRSIHSILSGDGGCSLDTRELSCYCDQCLDGKYEDCLNCSYVEQWKTQELERETGGHRSTRVSRGDTADAITVIKSLISRGSVVAIASADRGAEYYLLQVTSDGAETLKTEETDDWGGTYPPGAEVIRGNFLIKKQAEDTPYRYHVDSDKVAFVYAATARYICPELESSLYEDDQLICLTEDLHIEILESLNGF